MIRRRCPSLGRRLRRVASREAVAGYVGWGAAAYAAGRGVDGILAMVHFAH